MAGGFSRDGAVQQQIDASIADAIAIANRQLPKHNRCSAKTCIECDHPIPLARQQALPGVQRCVECQQQHDAQQRLQHSFNRRGSKDSQLR
ncbi:DksA/TraR family C4-type zinc finger protein [uncultured Ferrimonas sp.]|uniref:DksA/TraR family C4-type zinc finger protein n=1 Tax=uncultured Ferrimonas sp. TaxID=432640 RepID=UPI00260AA525|nr:DksA/TraR family C4-type zinc finger protein [uncultured Ferrimonas sp.]